MLLDGPDLFHLTQEAPGRPTHTIKLAVLDGVVATEDVRAWLAEAVARLPVLRRRIRHDPVRPAQWVGSEVDVDAHLTEHREAGRTLLEHIAHLAELPLDRDRPLWALHHVLSGEPLRSALVFRIHHALADGAASVRLWEALADTAFLPPEDHRPEASRLRHLAQIAADGPQLARRWRAHSRRLAQAGAEGRRAAVDPFTGPPTPFNRELEGRRARATADLPLDVVRAIRHRTGTSTTDVLLAACGGAIRRLLEDDGQPLDAPLTATVPAALPERQEPFGNAVTTLYVSLHTDIDDATARLAAISADVRSAREVIEDDPRLLADSQRRWRFYQGLVLAMRLEERRRGRPAYNAIVSSVRGPDRLELLGRPVIDLRSFGPLAGRLGLNLTAWSYDDRLAVGIHAFASATSDLGRLGRLLEAELQALAHASDTTTQETGALNGLQPG